MRSSILLIGSLLVVCVTFTTAIPVSSPPPPGTSGGSGGSSSSVSRSEEESTTTSTSSSEASGMSVDVPWMQNCEAVSVDECNNAVWPKYCIPCYANEAKAACIMCSIDTNGSDWYNYYSSFWLVFGTFVVGVVALLTPCACWPVWCCASCQITKMDRYLGTLPTASAGASVRIRRRFVVMTGILVVTAVGFGIWDGVVTGYASSAANGMLNEVENVVTTASDDVNAAVMSIATVLTVNWKGPTTTPMFDTLTGALDTTNDIVDNSFTPMMNMIVNDIVTPLQIAVGNVVITLWTSASFAVVMLVVSAIVLGFGHGRRTSCITFFLLMWFLGCVIFTRLILASVVTSLPTPLMDVQMVASALGEGPIGSATSPTRPITALDGICPLFATVPSTFGAAAGADGSKFVGDVCPLLVAVCGAARDPANDGYFCASGYFEQFITLDNCLALGSSALDAGVTLAFSSIDGTTTFTAASCYEGSCPMTDVDRLEKTVSMYATAWNFQMVWEQVEALSVATECFEDFNSPVAGAALVVVTETQNLSIYASQLVATGWIIASVLCSAAAILTIAFFIPTNPIPTSAEEVDAAYAWTSIEGGGAAAAAGGRDGKKVDTPYDFSSESKKNGGGGRVQQVVGRATSSMRNAVHSVVHQARSRFGGRTGAASTSLLVGDAAPVIGTTVSYEGAGGGGFYGATSSDEGYKCLSSSKSVEHP